MLIFRIPFQRLGEAKHPFGNNALIYKQAIYKCFTIKNIIKTTITITLIKYYIPDILKNNTLTKQQYKSPQSIFNKTIITHKKIVIFTRIYFAICKQFLQWPTMYVAKSKDYKIINKKIIK